MASTDISNQQIFDAAQAMGLLKNMGPFDLAGAQNSEFKKKIIGAITNTGMWPEGKQTDEVWNQLKTAARYKPDPSQSPSDQMLGAFKAYGVPQDQIDAAYNKARDLATQSIGMQPGGRQEKGANGRVVPFHVEDLATAVSQVMGTNSMVPGALKAAGMDRFIPQVTAQPTPSPAPPSTPSAAAPALAPVAPTVRAAAPAPAAARTAPARAATPAPPSNLGDDGTPKLAPAANQADTLAFIREHYGYGAWIFEQPDVAKILTDAAKDGHWSPARINGALMSTDFYKTHTGTTIAWMNTEANDPPTAAALVDQKVNEVIGKAQALGMDLDPDRARQIATDAKRYGWDDTQLTKAVGHEYHYNPTMAQKGVAKQIRDTARLYGVPMTDAGLDEWGRKVGSGDATADDFKATMINQAKSLFPTLAADLDRGATVKDIFDPYAKLAANTLGMDENTIDILDPKWQRPLQSSDGKNPTRMSTSDWSKTLRTDAVYGWDTTDNARQEAADFAHKIRQGFGLA